MPLSQRTPEQSLLLAAARVGGTSRCESTLHSLDGELDWTALIEAAIDHGVIGLLCDKLARLPDELVPPEIREAGALRLRRCEEDNRVLVDDLCRVLEALKEARIVAIPFKGPTLAIAAYGNLALREFRDLDFLIREADIASCLQVLQGLGYQQEDRMTPRQWQAFARYSGQDILFGGHAPVEPHWTFAPRTLALDLDYAGIWRRSVERDCFGRSMRALAPEDELTVLCVHGGKEKWIKLKWIADVAEYLSRNLALDWDGLTRRAEEQGISRMLRVGLELARQLLAAPMPGPAAAWLARDPTACEWTREIAMQYFDVRQPERSVYELSDFHWKIRERARDRWRYVFRTLTQPRLQHFQAVALPDRAFFLYTPYKVLHDYLALPLWKLRPSVRRIRPERPPAGGE